MEAMTKGLGLQTSDMEGGHPKSSSDPFVKGEKKLSGWAFCP